MTDTFWINWLKAACAMLIIMGIMSVLASHPAGAAPWHGLYQIIVTPEGGELAPFGQAGRFSNAIGGGIMIGWGVMLWLAVSQGLATGQIWVKRMIMVSALCWFVPDSIGSVMAGAPLNILPNLLFLAAFLVPLAKIGQMNEAAGTARP